MYHLTEKYDEKYFSYYYDVPEEDVVDIKGKDDVEVGVETDLNLVKEAEDFITQNDMSDPDNCARACELIDMDSFIDYYAVLIYCARCGDWPNGNYALWRTRRAPEEVYARMKAEGGLEDILAASQNASPDSPCMDGRWRWVLFDVNSAAISSSLIENDTLNYVLNKDPAPLFVSLSKNADFRKTFRERILEYGRTIFSPESVNAKLDQYTEEMTDAMDLNYRRFFGDDSGLDLRQIVDTEIRAFFEGRYSVVEKMLDDHFGNP